MAADPESGNATPKLCFAPPDRIPHPPHVWFDLDLGDGAHDEMVRRTPRYCDGWAGVLPDFLKGLRHG